MRQSIREGWRRYPPRRGRACLVAVACAGVLFATDSSAAGRPGRSLPRGTGRLSLTETTAGEPAWYTLESGPVRFGELLPGEAQELPAAVRVRVFSTRDWELRLRAAAPLRVVGDGSGIAPIERLAWRTRPDRHFTPLGEGSGAVIARGLPTGAGGLPVIVDLRLRLEDEDALGEYGCTLQLTLETL